jgi:hypothetical protein
MDTSQAHLSSKATVKDPSKPDNLSKDELTAVLKYGAQKMSVLILSVDFALIPYFLISLNFYIWSSGLFLIVTDMVPLRFSFFFLRLNKQVR